MEMDRMTVEGKNKKSKLYITIDQDTKDRIAANAKAHGLNPSQEARQMLEMQLKQQEIGNFHPSNQLKEDIQQDREGKVKKFKNGKEGLKWLYN